MKRFISYCSIFIFLIISANCPGIKGDDFIQNTYNPLLFKADNPSLPFKDRKKYLWRATLNLYNGIENTDSISRDQMLTVSYLYYSFNMWDSLEIVAKKALKNSFKNTPSHFYRGESYRFIGCSQLNKFNYSAAAYYFLKAKENYKKIKKKNYEALMDILMADIDLQNNKISEAEYSYVNALTSLKEGKNNDLIYRIYNSLGLCAAKLNDFDSSQKWHEKALDLAKSINKDHIIISLNNIASCLHAKKDFQTSNKYYVRALGKVNPVTIENAYLKALIIQNIALQDLDNLNFGRVENYLIKAFNIREKYKIEDKQDLNRLYLARYYLYNGEKEKAKIAAIDALTRAKKMQSLPNQIECLGFLCRTQSDKTFDYFKEFKNLNSNIAQINIPSRNKFARTAYEAQQLADERDKAERDNVLIAGSGSAISLGLLLLLSAKIQRARRRRVLLEKKRAESEVSMYKVLIDNQLLKAKAGIHQKHLLARELHDGVMNHLASTRLNLYQIHQEAKVNPVAHRKRFAEEIAKIEEELASIALRLDNTPLSLKELVSTLVQQHAQASEPLVRLLFEDSPHVETIDREVVATLYRILQETLHNAFKHACAKQILISFSANSSRVYFQILDDGKGFREENHQNGIGIRNIKNRVAELRGTIAINSGNGGTSIVIEIPTLPAA